MHNSGVNLGEIYGNLTVLKFLDPDPTKRDSRRRALCSCSCGRTTVVQLHSLQRGNTRSCGCLKRNLPKKGNKIVNKGDWSEIITSNGYRVLVDSEDVSKLAHFTWRAVRTGEQRERMRAATRIGVKKQVLMHRLLMNFPGELVDHKNRNSLDNRKENLRVASSSENRANTASRGGASRYKGVYEKNGKWAAQIQKDYLGTLETEIEAALAYDSEARMRYGEFAYLNFGGED